MFRNQYDTDVTTWSPMGRLHQVEYAMEAVKQGSACVGATSKDFAVVACIKRAASELASHQEKVFKIDDHMGIAISGLISDARILTKYMRNECLNHKYVYESAMPTQRLVVQISDKSQVYTQKDEKRPYGVGFLVIGYDADNGRPMLFQTSPSGNYFQYHAQAMGSRSQAAKTFLEKHMNEFPDCDADSLIVHALNALKSTMSGDDKFTTLNVSVGIVGKDREFESLDEATLRSYIERVGESGSGSAPSAVQPAADADDENVEMQ